MTKIIFVGTRVSDLSNTWGISSNDLYSNFSGNVGIGTQSPLYKLDVSGTARITSDTTICGSLFSQALTASSVSTSGSLSAGTSTLGATTICGSLVSQALTASSVSTSGSLSAGTSTLGATTICGSVVSQALTASSVSTSGSLSAGTSTLGATTICGSVVSQALTASSATVYGSTTICGTLFVTDISGISLGGGSSSQWSNGVEANEIYYNGKIAVGSNITNPAYTLDVSGNANITGSLSANSLSTSSLSVDSIALNGEAVFDLSGADEYLQVGHNYALYADTSANRVGIGKSTPSCALDVSGSILASSIQMNNVGTSANTAFKILRDSYSSAVGTGTSGITVNFGYTFSSPPIVSVNAIRNSSQYPCVVSLQSVTTTGFTYIVLYSNFGSDNTTGSAGFTVGRIGDSDSHSVNWIAIGM
jgi:hypothetical protein